MKHLMKRISELNILKKIAADIAKSGGDMPSELLTGFMAMVGHSYSNELMVIGRSVNGWGTGWDRRTWHNELDRDQFANDVFKSVTGGDTCPMQWVSECWGNYDHEYNTRKSQFWRVIRNMVSELKIADVENTIWPSHLVWSNLYKIAPCGGGNPSNQLCSLQFEGCKDLLHEEFRLYRPKRALFLTGYNWAGPFLAELNPSINPLPDYQYVEAAGQLIIEDIQGCQIVVAAHPQGKIEDVWISEVASVFED